MNGVPDHPPIFVFAGESGKSAALVRRRSLIFAPTVAKTVAIVRPPVGGQLVLYPIQIGSPNKEALRASMEDTGQRHRVPARVKHLAAEAGKGVAEVLRDIAVMVAGEAAKRAIWG